MIKPILNKLSNINKNTDANNSITEYLKLSDTLREEKKFNQAINTYHKIITINPREINAYMGLGNIFQEQKDYDNALNMYQVALAYQPDNKQALKSIGSILSLNPDTMDEAIKYFQQLITLDPTFYRGYWGLGVTLLGWGKADEAVPILMKAISLAPNDSNLYQNLGIAYYNQNKLLDAVSVYVKALELDPNCIAARLNLSLTLLKLGNYKQGWLEHEVRLEMYPEIIQSYPSQLSWQKNDDIRGKTILLYTEQGLGDSIQFIRYAPLLAKNGAKVIVHSEPELIDLFQSVEGISQIISKNELPSNYDLHCPLMSLPYMLNTTVETIPSHVPYIHIDSKKIKYWHNKTLNNTSKIKVGLVWAGNNKRDRGALAYYHNLRRSFSLDQYAPLADLNKISFYSLQKGEPANQIKSSKFELFDYNEEINNFTDTGALISQMDLVISSCTSVPHLAAAMGKPTWILLQFDACWRWLNGRDDSPWYPTVRLFRQEKPGDWETVMKKVKLALMEFSNNLST